MAHARSCRGLVSTAGGRGGRGGGGASREHLSGLSVSPSPHRIRGAAERSGRKQDLEKRKKLGEQARAELFPRIIYVAKGLILPKADRGEANGEIRQARDDDQDVIEHDFDRPRAISAPLLNHPRTISQRDSPASITGAAARVSYEKPHSSELARLRSIFAVNMITPAEVCEHGVPSSNGLRRRCPEVCAESTCSPPCGWCRG